MDTYSRARSVTYREPGYVHSDSAGAGSYQSLPRGAYSTIHRGDRGVPTGGSHSLGGFPGHGYGGPSHGPSHSARYYVTTMQSVPPPRFPGQGHRVGHVQSNPPQNVLHQRHEYHVGKSQYHQGMQDYHRRKVAYYQLRARQHWNPLKKVSARLQMVKHEQQMQRHGDLAVRQYMKAQKRQMNRHKLEANRLYERVGKNPAPRAKGSVMWWPH